MRELDSHASSTFSTTQRFQPRSGGSKPRGFRSEFTNSQAGNSMITLWLQLSGCAFDDAPPQPTENELYQNCTVYKHASSCYALRTAEPRTKKVALSTACDEAFQDACWLLYEATRGSSEVGDEIMAFSAARRGCKQEVQDLCAAALNWADTRPHDQELVERNRADLEEWQRKAAVGR